MLNVKIPSNYRWQELKDLLRSYGLSSFKQSHTDRFENDGTFYGSIAITGRADAYLAYGMLEWLYRRYIV